MARKRGIARPNDGRDDHPWRLEARDAEPLDPALIAGLMQAA